MAKMKPHGKVVNGLYENCNVYVWEENKSLAIIGGTLNNGVMGLFGEALEGLAYTHKCLLTSQTIKAYEDIGGVSHSADQGKVAVATVLFGAGAGILANQVGNQTVYSIIVQYINGENSLLQLNSWAYQNFKSVTLGVTQGMKKEKNHLTIEETNSITQVTQISAARNIIVDKDNIEASLKRIEMFLEEEDWDSASSYCESVLDVEPTNAQIFIYKLMIEFKRRFESELSKSTIALSEFSNYQKAIRFADDDLREKL